MKRRPGARDLKPAPGDLRLVQAFLNTLDREAGTDELASPRGLGDWLARQELLPAGSELDAADLQRVLAIRQGWHALISGAANTQEIIETLDDATAGAALRGRYGPGGVTYLQPAASGLDAVLGRLQLIAHEAQADDQWRLLKVCANPACRAVFYDYATNRSTRWCRTRCGNRLSARASRQRKRRRA